jgi:hypothetical protein
LVLNTGFMIRGLLQYKQQAVGKLCILSLDLSVF